MISTHRFRADRHCPDFKLVIQLKERCNVNFLIGGHRMKRIVYTLQDRGCLRLQGERRILMESHNFIMWSFVIT